MALHAMENKHAIKNVKLLKSVKYKGELDAWESLFINKRKGELMNIEQEPIFSPLFKL